MEPIQVRLVGTFEMRDSGGHDLAPRGAKARALVALLALTPDRRRRRRWIESHLWSDRSPEQASGSLRQALMELRRSLGRYSDHLRADREDIALEPLTVDVEAESEAASELLRSGRELLEGFDVRDEAWEDWLRHERAKLRARVSEPERSRDPLPSLPLVLNLDGLAPGPGAVFGLALANGIGRMLSEFAYVQVLRSRSRAVVELPERGLALHVEAAVDHHQVQVVAFIVAVRSGAVFWSRATHLPLDQAQSLSAGEMPALIFEAADATLAALARMQALEHPTERANALLARAVQEVFRYEAAGLRLADRCLIEAEKFQPSSVVSAWRAFVRQVMLIERTETDPVRLIEEVEAHSNRALGAGDASSLVLALVAAARAITDRTPVASMLLARDAMALEPQNPVVLAAQAGVLLEHGRPDEALRFAREGRRIATRSRLVHWLDALSGSAALATGQLSEATEHFEAAHARAPSYRAPMRHLIFLYEAQGRQLEAQAVVARLARAEPDFSVERVVSDPDYPAMTLRRMGLVRSLAGLD